MGLEPLAVKKSLRIVHQSNYQVQIVLEQSQCSKDCDGIE